MTSPISSAMPVIPPFDQDQVEASASSIPTDTPATPPDLPVVEPALIYEPVVGNGRVKQSRTVTFAHQPNMSVSSKRILARVLEQIGFDDQQLQEYYQLRVADIVADTTISEETARSFVKQAVFELGKVQWQFEDPTTGEYYFLDLLDTTKNKRVSLHKGVVTLILNPQLAPYFVKISGQYTIYKLDEYLNLHSWYSMRFYEILSTFRDTGWWEVSLDEFRQLMDCGPELNESNQPVLDKSGNVRLKHAETKDLIKCAIIKPQQELKSTPLAFTYQPLKAKQPGPGRKKVVGFRFDLISVVPTTIPDSWFNHAETARVIKRLREFKVSDHNLAAYLPHVTLTGAHKLIKVWELKENSNARIDKALNYCNKVFFEVGKKAQQEKQQHIIEQNKETRWAKKYAKNL